MVATTHGSHGKRCLCMSMAEVETPDVSAKVFSGLWREEIVLFRSPLLRGNKAFELWLQKQMDHASNRCLIQWQLGFKRG